MPRTRTISSSSLDAIKERGERLVRLIHEPPHLHAVNRASWSLALLLLGPAGKSEEAPGATENESAAGDAVSNTESMRQLEAAHYYMSRRNYIGAINRFQAVAKRFPSSSVVDQALFGLMQAYLTLGILSEAKAATAVLNRKFPESRWRSDALDILQKAGLEPAEDEKSWISRAFQ
jgi:outer membrane protein assembly factor BamD